jgi:hypothetical protein
VRRLFLLTFLVCIAIHGIFLPPVQSPSTACRSATESNRFGVNEVLGWPGLYTADRLETSLSLMQAAGIGWVRVTWAWKDMQPQAGDPFDYAHLDAVAASAAQHHVQILPILLAVPAWASSAPAALKAAKGNLSPVDHYRPNDIQDWLTYVRSVVERYDGDGSDDAPGSPRMAYWEVWNEENIAMFWPDKPDASEYLALLKATYQTIKAADPSAKVVLGGLANADSGYLKSLYEMDGAPYFDVVSIHLYSYPAHGIDPVVNAVSAIRNLMDSEGDQAKPLWLTEIGWSDAPNAWGAPTVSQDEIASFVTAVYTASLPADLIFWYNFRNIFPNSTDVEHNFGLVNADFTPKPSFKAYEARSQPCPENAATSR